VNSLCNQRLGLLTQRFSTGLLPKNVDIHASGARDDAAHIVVIFKKTLIINDLSGLSKAFPQACTQKVWISPRSASLGAALRRMARFAKKLPGLRLARFFLCNQWLGVLSSACPQACSQNVWISCVKRQARQLFERAAS
jgi:hypothetical protein